MNAPHPKKMIAGVALASLCFVAGVLFPWAAPELAIVTKVMFVLAAFVVALPTFEWGAALGYRVQGENGALLLGNILRCVTMTAILGFVSVALAGIIVGLCFSACR